MELFALSIRVNAQIVFQFSKALAKIILMRSHRIECIETHLDVLFGVGSKL